VEHKFTGPAFTIGVEEELMIIGDEDLDLAQEIETLLAAVPEKFSGQVKPELMQSVLEVATTPCDDVASAAEQLQALRRCVREVCEERGLSIGAAGTHPFADPDRQLIVDRPRYRELAAELGFIARQEIIFGTHVHVGMDDPDRAIYVADGIRRYLPLMLALSSNSPFWRGKSTGMMSARTAVFRAFPRVGVPPHYGTWEIYSHRVETMVRSGAIDDYTYLWWDVRPHPNLGTVETRIFDQQTRLEHTVALTALTVALAHRSAALYDSGEPLVEQPTELVDDNKVRAALRGMDGELVDFRAGHQVPAREMASRLLDEVREDAQELGCEAELDGIRDLVRGNTGARKQIQVWKKGEDMKALVREIVEKSRT
jgi:glutamate---cysteine ligase / carboxylate-amine ligase